MSIKLRDGDGGFLKAKLIALTTTIALSGVTALVPLVAVADHSTAHTIEQLSAQIAQLQLQLAALSGGAAAPAGKCSFTRDLSQGVNGDDVKCLQDYLTSAGHFSFSGGSTGHYGSITKAAVSAWQTANGVSPTAGYFGPRSRAKYDALVAAAPAPAPAPAPGVAPAPAPAGTGLTVSAPSDQPAQTLAPNGAARLPFTKVIFTASADGDISVKSVTVERQGLADDAIFDSIVFLDETGTQVGNTRTLGSDHRVIFNEAFTVKAGTSRTFTIAANMAASLTNYAGQVARLSVVAADAGSAQVNGTFPISGNGMVVNATLSIGTITIAKGSRDPSSSTNKEVGTTGVIFSSVRFTAGSQEDMHLMSIRWNQSGSAAASDISNIKVYVEDRAYDVTVSSDGKYYTANFDVNEKVGKGESREVYIKGDVAGGSGRSIDFDLYRRTDVVVHGITFGYNITPPDGTASSGTDDSKFHLSTLPWWDGSEVTVKSGKLRVESSSTVASGNASVGTSVQTLAAFKFVANGEPINVTKVIFDVDVPQTKSGSTSDLTSIALYNANGAVIAGPVDGKDGSTNGDGTITYTNTFTVAVGETIYTLKGKVGSDYEQNQTFQVKITPSTGITATGQNTTNTVVADPASAIAGPTMTVKSAALAIAVSLSPGAQNVVNGVNAFGFASYILDATNSGEDVRVTSLKLQDHPTASANTNELNTCQVYNGSTAITTGGNIINPGSNTAATAFTFNLDSQLTVAKGTTKVLDLKCNLSSSAVGAHAWAIATSSSAHGLTGASSATAFDATYPDDIGQVMTVKTKGSLAVSLDTSSPGYKIVAAGTADNTNTIIKLSASDEAINVTQIGIELSGPAASSSPGDIMEVTFWDGATKVGSTIFSTRQATTSLTGVTVPKDGSKLLSVKITLAGIGTGGLTGTQGAFIKVDYDGSAGDTAGNATRGTGQASGQAIYATGADTATAGIRMFRGYPTVARITTGLPTSYGGGQSGVRIYRFSVKANSRDVGLFRLTFRVATSSTPSGTSSTTVTQFKVYGYTDSAFSQPVSPWDSGNLSILAGLAGSGSTDNTVVFSASGAPSDQKLTIPLGSTYYFEAIGDITLSGSPTGGAVSTQLMGDSAYPSLSGLMSSTTGLAAASNLFVWSPNATTTSLTTHADWTNGFRVDGLPGTGLDSYTINK